MAISVVIPAHDAESVLDRCLAALRASTLAPAEIVVVDDASRDRTASVARRYGARVIRQDQRRGPAAARNSGALHTVGSVIAFVDADVCLHPTALEQFAERFDADPGLAAAFGSYDEAPVTQPFFSLYKNLFHHFVHQQADEEARTFWAGCGAIRRRALAEAGGFNERYGEPSIEDIELGRRIHGAGGRIILDRTIQCTHLKRWSLAEMVVTDVCRRAVPWARLLLNDRDLPADLNLRWTDRLSTVIVFLGLMLAMVIVIWPPATGIAASLFAVGISVTFTVVALNHRLYRFFARRAGLWFAMRALPVHAFYYLYSGLALLWAALTLNRAPRPEGSLSQQSRQLLESCASGSETASLDPLETI